jgi:hypothetical protein
MDNVEVLSIKKTSCLTNSALVKQSNLKNTKVIYKMQVINSTIGLDNGINDHKNLSILNNGELVNIITHDVKFYCWW